MTKQWKAVLGVFLIFIFGWVSGALCLSLILGHRANEMLKRGPEAVVELLERRLTRHVALDATQKEQVHQLFLENVKQRKQLQQQIQPQIRELNLQTFQQINELLRPEQREIFDQNVEQFRKRFGKYALNPEAENSPMPEAPPANPAANAKTDGS